MRSLHQENFEVGSSSTQADLWQDCLFCARLSSEGEVAYGALRSKPWYPASQPVLEQNDAFDSGINNEVHGTILHAQLQNHHCGMRARLHRRCVGLYRSKEEFLRIIVDGKITQAQQIGSDDRIHAIREIRQAREIRDQHSNPGNMHRLELDVGKHA